MENDWLKLLYVGEELLCKKNLLGTECAIGANTLWYYYYYIIKVAHLIKPDWLSLTLAGCHAFAWVLPGVHKSYIRCWLFVRQENHHYVFKLIWQVSKSHLPMLPTALRKAKKQRAIVSVSGPASF